MDQEHLELIKRLDRFELWQLKIDDWRNAIEVKLAKDEVDRIHIDKRFDKIEKDLNDLKSEFKSTMRFVTYAIIGAAVTQIMGFVFEGGFHTK